MTTLREQSRPTLPRGFAIAMLAFTTLALAGPATATGTGLETRVLWSTELPRAPDTTEDIVVTEVQGGEPRIAFRPRETGTAAPTPLPVGAALLPLAKLSAFGGDRCRSTSDGHRLSIVCAEGSAPAGVIMTFADRRLPAGADLGLYLRSAGDPGFAAKLVKPGHDADDPIGLTSPSNTLPIDAEIAGSPAQLVIVAPAAGRSIALTELGLHSRNEAQTLTRSAWAWDPMLWRADPDHLVRSARARRLNRLFVGIEVVNGTVSHPGALRRFLSLARSQGIAVEAVEGDPHMVLSDGLQVALARASAIAAFQAASDAESRLDGVQYDIEPYALTRWGEEPAGYGGWANAIMRLSEVLGAPVGIAVPFWLANDEGGRAMLDAIQGSVREVTVMTYRTEAAEWTQVGEPLLAWGVARNKPIRLALEAGRVDDEVEHIYVAAERGTLAVFDDKRIALLEAESAVVGARMYRKGQQVRIRGSRVSFRDDEAAMTAMAERTAPAFGAWRSFVGFAFHGFDWSKSRY